MVGSISLEGMEFYAHHGFYPEERIIGNKYEVSVNLEVDFQEAADHDSLEGTINYETIYDEVKNIMSVETKLLEHIAAKIISRLKKSFPQLVSVEVSVSKLNPPIKGLCKRATVTLAG
ncbi:MAG: dihydroneopterin aldolase [Cyclobacteriaceae bacterium]